MFTTLKGTLPLAYFDLFETKTFSEALWTSSKELSLYTRLALAGLATFWEKVYGPLPKNKFYTIEYQIPRNPFKTGIIVVIPGI